MRMTQLLSWNTSNTNQLPEGNEIGLALRHLFGTNFQFGSETQAENSYWAEHYTFANGASLHDRLLPLG